MTNEWLTARLFQKSNVVEVQSPLIKFLWNPNLYFSALKALRGFKFRKMDPFLGETNEVGATKLFRHFAKSFKNAF